MADADDKPRVPSGLKKLVLDYQNTCVFMLKLWRRLAIVMAVALPSAFFLRESNLLQAMINAIGLWLVFAVVSRFLVLEFRLLRAGWVARKIETRIPPGHPSRGATIDWIEENNDGNFLNSLLSKLGAPARASVSPFAGQQALSSTTSDPTAFINGVLEKLGKQQQQSVQTYIYSSQTQVLNEDGEWVTVESHDSQEDGPPPEAAVQQALNEATPPEGFKPIPIRSSAKGGPKNDKKRRKRRRKRSKHMPLDPESFDPEAAETNADGEERI
jgi:hypothetical protein